MRILSFIFALPLLFVANASQAQTFTGCLKSNGTIVKVAIGEAPSAPCGGDSQQISWNSEGPQGGQGPQGPQGPTGPAGPPGLDAPIYIFAGFSDVTVTGGVGLVGLYDACQAKFGPDSRMCTSQEILNSADLPPQTGSAWVRPEFIGMTFSNNTVAADVSGIEAVADNLTCRGWSINDFTKEGLFVNNALSFGRGECNNLRAVACCALQ